MTQVFFRGLITLLPIALTIYIIVGGFRLFENWVGSALLILLPESYYIPGLGLFVSISLIFIFGLMLNNYLIGTFLKALENRMTRVPLIKAVYSPLRDLMNLFSSSTQGQALKRVVLVKLPGTDALALGLVTRESFRDLKLESMTSGRVAVYIPMSYGLGGYTLLLPREALTAVDLPADRALSLAITGWVKADPTEEIKP